MRLTKNLLLNDVQLKFSSSGAGSFTGYASVFDTLDSHGDIIVKGAYDAVLSRITKGQSPMPKMFVNHDWRVGNLPVGKYTHISADSKGVLMSGEFTPGNQRAVEVRAAMEHSTVDGMSVGIVVGEREFDNRDGQKVRVIKSIDELMEVSIVTFPSNGDARVDLSTVKSALDEIKTVRDFESFLRDEGGFSRAAAEALAMRCRGVFARGEPDVMQLPTDLAAQIARNLKDSQTL